MDYELFDAVKFERAKAIATFDRFRNTTKTFKFVEVIAVLLVLLSGSWICLPAAVKFSGDFWFELSVYLFKSHVVFLIGNAIIVAVVMLCRQTDAVSNSINADIYYGEVQQPIATTRGGDVVVPSPASLQEAAEPNFDEVKPIICSESKVWKMQFDDDAAAKKQIERLQRTQSEKLNREIASNPSRQRSELRRSETEMRRIRVSSGDRRRKIDVVETVEKLSNEEFRLTIEAFIKKNQLFFEKQRLYETD